MSDFSTSKWVRARKPHRCEECARTINFGELYLYHFEVAEGANYTLRHCDGCADLRTRAWKETFDMDEEAFPQPGELVSGMREYYLGGTLMPAWWPAEIVDQASLRAWAESRAAAQMVAA